MYVVERKRKMIVSVRSVTSAEWVDLGVFSVDVCVVCVLNGSWSKVRVCLSVCLSTLCKCVCVRWAMVKCWMALSVRH